MKIRSSKLIVSCLSSILKWRLILYYKIWWLILTVKKCSNKSNYKLI